MLLDGQHLTQLKYENWLRNLMFLNGALELSMINSNIIYFMIIQKFITIRLVREVIF